jgi:hypothetical protein
MSASAFFIVFFLLTTITFIITFVIYYKKYKNYECPVTTCPTLDYSKCPTTTCPEPTVCPTYEPTTCPPATTCPTCEKTTCPTPTVCPAPTIFKQYVGYDLPSTYNKNYYKVEVDECIGKCNPASGCTAVSFNTANKACYVMNPPTTEKPTPAPNGDVRHLIFTTY